MNGRSEATKCRSENGALKSPCKDSIPLSEKPRRSLSAGILHSALQCQEFRRHLHGTPLYDRLKEMLRRWQSLGYPDPKLPLGERLLLEFERFLDSHAA